MKIIEAMKAVKAGKEKIDDLRKRISSASANLSNETPLYGADTNVKITGWLQAIEDISHKNVELLVAIQRTNLATPVTITIGTNNITKTIAEWVWRRREYAVLNQSAWSALTDRNLKAQTIAQSTGQPIEIKVVRHFDATIRDNKIDLYRSEPHAIDASLEVVNAITDLV